MLSLSSASLLVKNSLVDTGSWIILLDLVSPDTLTHLRICSNTENVIKDGEVYNAFPFEIDEVTENTSGELPILNLKVNNINRLVQSYVEQDETLGSDWDITLQIIHSSNMQNYATYSQKLTEDVWLKTGVTVTGGTTSEFLDPFGKLNAYTILDTNTSPESNIKEIIGPLATSPNCSTYIRNIVGDTAFRLGIYSEELGDYVLKEGFQYTSGILNSTGPLVGTGTIGIEAVDHDWFRVNMVSDTWTSGHTASFVILPTDGVAHSTAIQATGVQVADMLLPYTPTDATNIAEGILANPELVTTFRSISVSADAEWVTFKIGMANPLRMVVPRTKYLATSCQHTYKQGGCPYAGPLQSCLKTLADCDAHFPAGSVLPFLGFPGIATVSIYT